MRVIAGFPATGLSERDSASHLRDARTTQAGSVSAMAVLTHRTSAKAGVSGLPAGSFRLTHKRRYGNA